MGECLSLPNENYKKYGKTLRSVNPYHDPYEKTESMFKKSAYTEAIGEKILLLF